MRENAKFFQPQAPLVDGHPQPPLISADTLSIAYLNVGYCTKIDKLYGFLKTHYHHLRHLDHKIAKYADPNIAMRFVDEVNADIVILAEILGRSQREILAPLLAAKGYNHIHYGEGQNLHGPGYEEQKDGIVIASRRKIELLQLNEITEDESVRHGLGGGMAAVHVYDFDCDVFAGHLPQGGKKWKPAYDEHSRILVDGIKRSESGRVVLVGDFNMSPERLSEEYPGLVEGLELLSPNEPTCTMVRPLNWIVSECFDQMWGRGVRSVNARTVIAQSDHLGLRAEVMPSLTKK